MSSGERIPREQAELLEGELFRLLAHTCTQWEAAGSIRRRCHTVGDIEIVARPRMVASTGSLFDELPCGREHSALTTALDEMVAAGEMEPRLTDEGRKCWGERHQRALYKGVAVDVFQVIPPAQWGVILAIRTGPYEFSRHMMTSVAYGGLMPKCHRVIDGALWRVGWDGETKEELIETATEADFFRALGFEMVPRPEIRYTLVPGSEEATA